MGGPPCFYGVGCGLEGPVVGGAGRFTISVPRHGSQYTVDARGRAKINVHGYTVPCYRHRLWHEPTFIGRFNGDIVTRAGVFSRRTEGEAKGAGGDSSAPSANGSLSCCQGYRVVHMHRQIVVSGAVAVEGAVQGSLCSVSVTWPVCVQSVAGAGVSLILLTRPPVLVTALSVCVCLHGWLLDSR